MKQRVFNFIKTKKFLIVLLVFVVLFALLFINSKTNIISFSKLFKEGPELALDNWEMSTVFYDSKVNDGRTPLTQIEWDASDGGYGQGEPRVITIQVNYKNNNCQNDFEKGDLNIYIPWIQDDKSNLDIVTNTGANDDTHVGYDWNVEYFKSARVLKFSNNVEFHKNTNFEGSITIKYTITPKSEDPELYDNECLHLLNQNIRAVLLYKDEDYQTTTSLNASNNYSYEDDTYDFYVLDASGYINGGENELAIESNFGTRFFSCSVGVNYCTFDVHSPFLLDERIKVFYNKLERPNSMRLNILGYNSLAKSNEIVFSYQRKYIHEWHKYEFPFEKTVERVSSLDGIENAADYYWIKYNFSVKDSSYHRYHGSTIYSKNDNPFYVYDEFPSDVVVYSSGSIVTPYEDNKYRFSISGRSPNVAGAFTITTRKTSIYVGYPKSNYNNTNSHIVNKADLYAMHDSDDDYSYQTSDTIDFDLFDYTNYDVKPSVLSKSMSSNYIMDGYNVCGNCYYSNYYQAIAENDTSLTNGNMFAFEIENSVNYLGKPLTVKVGDDYLIVSNGNGGYRKLNDDEYHIGYLKIRRITNIYGQSIVDKYNWKLYVRKENSNNYDLYKENITEGLITIPDEDKVVDYYFYAEDVVESINMQSYCYIYLHTTNIPTSGRLYNSAFFNVYAKNGNDLVLQNAMGENTYDNFMDSANLKQYDLNKYGYYIQRKQAMNDWEYYEVYQPRSSIYPAKVARDTTMIQDENNKKFYGRYEIAGLISAGHGNDLVYNSHHATEYDEQYGITGIRLYDLLPEGMDVTSSAQEIFDSMNVLFYNSGPIVNQDFEIIDSANTFYDRYIVPNFSTDDIIIQRNWNDTNRTKITINISFGGNKFYLFNNSYSDRMIKFTFDINTQVSYDSLAEFGTNYKNVLYAEKFGNETAYLKNYAKDEYDINENGDSNEYLSVTSATMVINSVVSTNQDLVVSAQSNLNNFDTNKINAPSGGEYYYKLRVRTGTNGATNLVIYDSLEKYAKDTNMEFIGASGGRGSWQGVFLGVDTSYAESKGYNVKVYYSDSEEPGSLKTDNRWKEYDDNVDKSMVKSLAFEYLDSEGNPAILPTNSLTYVLIKMRSPEDVSIKTLAYNGCWTEWNAVDSVTGNPVDFITGINSNIVKVALPNSVEPVDMDFKIDKYWRDNADELGVRPDTIIIQVIPDGDLSKAIDVPLSSTNIDSDNPNHWSTTISVPKYDLNSNTIAYTVREDEIILDDGYKYTPQIDDNKITNVLTKEVILKKKWLDNGNSYLTRSGNVTYMLKQNGSDFKEVVITGDYSTNEWNKAVTVPVYDPSNNKYNYSIEEYEVQNYVSNCNDYTCTNTLTASDSINVSKEWKDNNNSYGTRPNSVTIHLLRNGVQYKNITLNGNNNWNSNVEVDKYDSNGREYTYTISEDEVDEYGLVTYDQNNYKVTNTLNANTNIVITKKWIDDDNSNSTRPEQLRITLLRNGEDYQVITLSGDGNTWTTSVEVPKYDDNQKEYKYSIKEINDNNIDDYTDITYSEDELTVTNKLSKKTDLTIKKKWIDNDNEYSSRPSEVNIYLLRDGDLFKELTLTGNSDTWKNIVKDVPVYDDNGRKYNYTISEDNINRYEKVTYDQTNLEVTNELTEIPTVTLYFTVVNGYVDPKTGKMKYDEFGLNEVLEKYNVSPDDEYIFKFKLENTDTHKTYDGKLSTKGILEFKDIPYGDYKAVVGKDKLFEFVDMLSIKEVNGVSFKKIGKEGYISIKPTGENIIFGAKIINRIVPPIKNPKTGLSWLILLVFILPIVSLFLVKNKKEY